MLVISLALMVALVGVIFIFGQGRHWTDDMELKTGAAVMSLVAIGVLTFPLVKMTSGLLPQYSEGIREGYITKISRRGFLWKTWEAQLQVGIGEQAAFQTPWDFSVKEEDVLAQLRKMLGKRVVLSYREWAIMPYSVGESKHEALKVEAK